MYTQQKIFCEGTLEEMMEAVPGVKDAQKRPATVYVAAHYAHRSYVYSWFRSWESRSPAWAQAVSVEVS